MHTIIPTILMLSLWSLCWPSPLVAHGPDVSQWDSVEATVTRTSIYPPRVPLTPLSPQTLEMTEEGDHPLFGAYTCEGMQDFAHGFGFTRHPAHATLAECGHIYLYVFQEWNADGDPVPAPLQAACEITETGQAFTVEVAQESVCIPYSCLVIDYDNTEAGIIPHEGCEYTAFWEQTVSYTGDSQTGDPQLPSVMETSTWTMTTAVTATLTYTEVTWNAEDLLLWTVVESEETGTILAITRADSGM